MSFSYIPRQAGSSRNPHYKIIPRSVSIPALRAKAALNLWLEPARTMYQLDITTYIMTTSGLFKH